MAVVRIQQEVNLGEQCFLQSVGSSPIDKKSLLVFEQRALGIVFHTQVADLVVPLSLLDFPAGQVSVHKNVWVGMQQGGSRSEYKNQTRGLLKLPTGGLTSLRIEPIFDLKGVHPTEDGIVR